MKSVHRNLLAVAATAATAAAVAMGVVACADVSRSRDLGDPEVAGATLAQQVCSNCHGVTGMAVSPNVPNLAAQQPDYLAAQLKGFRERSRRDPAGYEYMWGISRKLTDRQIEELAAYYAAQSARSQPVEGTPAAAGAGQTIFENGLADKGVPPCGTCHGSDAFGKGAFPRLAGQHADYLVKQLTVFQRTDERPEGGPMKTVAHALSHTEFTQVAAYLQSMPSLPAGG